MISSSPGDLQPVFETMLENAVRLCEASQGAMFRVSGDILHRVASSGLAAELALVSEVQARPSMPMGQMLSTRKTVHVPDYVRLLAETPTASPHMRIAVEQAGVRSTLWVPMVKDNEVVGALALNRREARPFTDNQIELVENFAAQAVIAIENARLLTELRELLDRQTATADILRVIASTPGDPKAALDTIAETAVRMFDASSVGIRRVEQQVLRQIAAAGAGASPCARRPELPLDSANPGYRCVIENRQIHFEDQRAVPYADFPEAFRGPSVRSQAFTPLTREGHGIGVMIVNRTDVRSFRPDELELMRGFADQAVIAIENARLLTELRVSLDRQTATSEVLGVISSSPGELEPVFDTILENALRLCDADTGNLFIHEGDVSQLAAVRGALPEWEQFLRQRGAYRPASNSIPAQAICLKAPVHSLDLRELAEYAARGDGTVAAVERGGVRTQLVVPIIHENSVIGTIIVYRREVRAFTQTHVDVVVNFAKQAVIAIENARLLTELRELLDRQTATSEVLGVISASPGDLEPVFDTLIDNALRLCEAEAGQAIRVDGDMAYTVAHRGVSPTRAAHFAAGWRPVPDGPLAQMIRAGATVHVADLHDSEAYRSGYAPVKTSVDIGGVRSILLVPMVRVGAVIGGILMFRREVRPFSDKQIELVENFAKQAVIAIENARLLTELRELLENQTASAEVLRTIAGSPAEAERALDTIAEVACRLFDASSVNIRRLDGNMLRFAASVGRAARLVRAALPEGPVDPKLLSGAAILERRQIVLDDTLSVPDSIRPPSGSDMGPRGSRVATPLLREGQAIGALIVIRDDVRPFTEKELMQLRNFADQAVIAIENARLLTELRESLDRQTATAEVLGVISSTPGELEPVFDTMLENAVRLCSAVEGSLFRIEGTSFQRIASRGLLSEVAAQRDPVYLANTPPGRMLRGKKTVHVADLAVELQENPEIGQTARAAFERGGVRSVLWVPMVRDDSVIGAFVLNRREVQPFTDKQIELVENFAAQAVIAIENARLLNELRELLDRQTATAEVLSVISASPGELQPVYETMVENAVRLCEAAEGSLFRLSGDVLHRVASRGISPDIVAQREVPIAPGTPVARMVNTKAIVHTHDLLVELQDQERADPTNETVLRVLGRIAVERSGVRTMIWAPLVKDHAVVGTFVLSRREVRPFTDKQIELVENFAAQAVIAIENARLLTELRTRTDELTGALEQQTATSDVLGVISSSPGELEPVFGTILENALRLCEADQGNLYRLDDGGHLHLAAMQGALPAYEQYLRDLPPFQPGPETAVGRAMRQGETTQLTDLRQSPAYAARNANAVASVELGGTRTLIHVPMMRDQQALGVIIIYRREVREFDEKQVRLVENFAKQAVIAIENARLLSELRESLDRQTATAEVLGVISSSPGELQPVFETMVRSAVRICEAAEGSLFRLSGRVLYRLASFGMSEQLSAQRELPIYPGSTVEPMLERKATVQIHDLLADVQDRERADPGATHVLRAQARIAVERSGIRSIMWVPLVKDHEVVGAFLLSRREVRPFSDKQVELVENFAAQAVIAIENARLLTELRESLDRQTATADILRVIASTPGDPTRSLDTISETALRMFGASSVNIRRRDGNLLRMISAAGPTGFAMRRALPEIPIDTPFMGQCVTERRQIDVEDLQAVAEGAGSAAGRLSRQMQTRAAAYTPLMREGEAIGGIAIMRSDVLPFRPDELELMRGFADQAVIAIENARLLTELRESLDRQTATSDVLRVISSSPSDVDPVFDAILENAVRLCEADMGHVHRVEGETLRLIATRGASEEYDALIRQRGTFRPDARSAMVQTIREKAPLMVDDLREHPNYIERLSGAVAMVETAGVRTLLQVPVVKDGDVVGLIVVYRREVRPFTQKHVELVENFAAQAVIAIENARLLTELRESLDRQTATADILRVIASTPGNSSRALDKIAETAVRMFNASSVSLRRIEDGRLRSLAAVGPASEAVRAGVGDRRSRCLFSGRPRVSRKPPNPHR